MRNMAVVGSDASKYINNYSQRFQRDFLQLLRALELNFSIIHFAYCDLGTAHSTKAVHMNHFYQEYIGNKEHVHMNATRWPSLTEFAKHLGREGICRVEDKEDKGLFIAWIDSSPEALRKQDAIRKKERQDRGDEEREQKLIKEQIARANTDAEIKSKEVEDDQWGKLRRQEGDKIKLSFGSKPKENEHKDPPTPPLVEGHEQVDSTTIKPTEEQFNSPSPPRGVPTPPPEKVALKMSMSNKPKNVFAASSKKNALGGAKPPVKETPKRPMSEAERIMKEEIERKRMRESHGGPGLNAKRTRLV